MALAVTNNAVSKITGPMNPSATTFTITTGDGDAKFPVTTGGNYYWLKLVNAAGSVEFVKVTGRTGDAFTVVRAQDGSIALTFSAGDAVSLVLNAAALGEFTKNTDFGVMTGDTLVHRKADNSAFELISWASMGDGVMQVRNLAPRNEWINGRLDFWQRGWFGNPATGRRFFADRLATDSAGSTLQVTQASFLWGQTDVPGNPTYFHVSVISSVSGAANYARIYTRLEDVTKFSGRDVTLSFYARADASRTIAVEFAQQFGTGGAPSAIVYGIGVTSLQLNTSWQRYIVHVTLPSIAGKTVGSNGDDCLEVSLWVDAGSTYNARTNALGQQSATLYVACFGLFPGLVAPVFPEVDRATELLRCQRFYENSYSENVEPGSIDNTGASNIYMSLPSTTPAVNIVGHSVDFKAVKCVIPTITLYSTATGAPNKVRDLQNSADANLLAITPVGNAGFRWIGVPTAASVVTNLQGHWTAEAEL